MLLLALVAAAVLVPGVPASAQDSGAEAVNTKDGKSVFKLAFSVMLVSGDPDVVTPENVAVAINYDCTECETLARAYQFVFGNGEDLTFTQEGKARLQELKKQVQDLKKRDDLTLQQLAAALAVIAAEVADVVEEEVVPKSEKNAEPAVTTTAATGSAATTTPPPPPTTTLGPAPTTTRAPATSTTIGATTTTSA